MLGTAIIIFREVLEAALIVGLVLGVTRDVPGRLYWVSAGIGGGVVGSVALAYAADFIAPLAAGMGQEVMQATILFIAVGMLSWHMLWMRKHAIKITQEMKRVGQAVSSGDREPFVLGLIISLVILREGSESVIFLYGLAAAGSNSSELLFGGLLGIVAGVAVGMVLYFGITRLPTGRLFQVSSWLLLLLTAGLVSQAVSYLVQADLLPALGNAVWDSSFLLPEHSLPGRVLHILVGYVDRPMGIQLLAYLLTVALLSVAMTVMNQQQGKPRETSRSPSPPDCGKQQI